MKERIIKCENSLERMWGLFLFFTNTPSAKEHLYHSYLAFENEKEANKLAFENAHKFIFFLKQGKSYFHSAQQSELIVRPLLLYYGFTSLMKALLLLKDPYYPRTTSVLQHGMTTRKKKKSNYVFHEDEIKVQKDGLLPHFSQIVLKEPLTIHGKHKALQLLSVIPELQDSIMLVFQHSKMIPLPSEHLAHYDEEQILKDYRGQAYVYLEQPVPLTQQIIVYNMLMFMLGMLCRYDTELWGELIFSFHSNDMYIIEEFLQLSMRIFPNLILNKLFDEIIIFET